MCGIVGILGRSDVTERVVEGLSRLEYSGYDSGGVALMDENGTIASHRSVGRREKTLSNAAEVNPRGARVWHVAKAPAADLVLPPSGAILAPSFTQLLLS